MSLGVFIRRCHVTTTEQQKRTQYVRHLAMKLLLLLAVAAAIRVRLYGVERYGIYIDEYQPYHHYRAAKVFSEMGSLTNYFDTQAWHPMGVPKGGSAGMYPGLIGTAVISRALLNAVWQPLVGAPVSMYNVCVFLPIFAAAASTALAYLLTVELSTTTRTRTRAEAYQRVAHARGICAAGFVAIVPGYVYRSVAGLYDNESIGIAAMLLACYAWCCACRNGTVWSAVLFGVSFGYLASVWSTGCLFVGCAVPLHIVVLWMTGDFQETSKNICGSNYVGSLLFNGMYEGLNRSVYTAFTYGVPSAIVAGAILSPFFQMGWSSPWLELCMWWSCYTYVRVQWGYVLKTYGAKKSNLMWIFLFFFVILVPVAVVVGYSRLLPLVGRLSTIGFAPNTVVSRSVSSTKPTTWAQYFIDLHLLSVLFPAGLSYTLLTKEKENSRRRALRNGTNPNGSLFVVVCSMLAMVVTSIQASAMPLLAVWSSIMSAMAVGEFIVMHVQMIWDSTHVIQEEKDGGWGERTGHEDEDEDEHENENEAREGESAATPTPAATTNRKKNKSKKKLDAAAAAAVENVEIHSGQIYLSMFLLLGVFFAALFYWWHCSWIASNMYSTPSILVPARNTEGKDTAFDDFREAYQWIDQHTPADSKVLAWWDYGYHLTTMANRTTLVDNMAPLLDENTVDGRVFVFSFFLLLKL